MPDARVCAGCRVRLHAVQTARVMERLEPVLLEQRPDLVIVPGDVNSTLAATLVAVKLRVPVAHLEAGLRSFDRTHAGGDQPDRRRRVQRPPLHPLGRGAREPARRGDRRQRIHFVGNTMIDSLVAMESRFRGLRTCEQLGLRAGDYLLVTLHRPALVDGPLLADALAQLARDRARDAGGVPGASADPQDDGRHDGRSADVTCSSRSAISTSSRSRTTPGGDDRLGRGQEETTYWGCRASPSATTPSARLPSGWARTRCLAWIRRGSPTSCRLSPRTGRPGPPRHRAGTATPPSVWQTSSSATQGVPPGRPSTRHSPHRWIGEADVARPHDGHPERSSQVECFGGSDWRSPRLERVIAGLRLILIGQ